MTLGAVGVAFAAGVYIGDKLTGGAVSKPVCMASACVQRLLPQNRTDTRPRPDTQRTSPDDDSDRRQRLPYAMRAQIQQGNNNISSASVESDKPITARQVQMAFLQANADVPSGYGRYRSGIDAAVLNMMSWVYNTSLSGGVVAGGNVHREWLGAPRPTPNIRLDLENLRGHNLRTPW
jgi:hypothetical protein